MDESPNQMVLSEPSDQPITDSLGNAWRIAENHQVSANGVLDKDRAPVLQVCYVNQTIWRQRRDLSWQSKRHPTDPWLPKEGRPHSPLSGNGPQAVGDIEEAIAEVLGAVMALQAGLNATSQFYIVPYLTAIEHQLKALVHAVAMDQSATVDALTTLRADFDANVGTAVLPQIQNLFAVQAQTAQAQQTAILRAMADMFATQEAADAARHATVLQGLAELTAGCGRLQTTLEAGIGAILAELNEILAIIKSLEPPPPVAIALDIGRATHTLQAIPPKG